MRNRINSLITVASAVLIIGGLVFHTTLDTGSPRKPDPTTGQVFRVSMGKGGGRYVTAADRRNYYIAWGAILFGVIVITAVQKGALDFSEKHSE
jgi:hypothetical protein